ncbi:type I glutamate--ammonia ligase [Flaviflexus huanghaiensis]|uniref:type I glutamate--ammonia ligase n=1 Tax=Flaviflexus huanghaiensis TaxID=1111473 RepID=UPI0015F7B1D3|nr:type I glutamate--ammonia ligase [Flaviflexus huanghaiensis]
MDRQQEHVLQTIQEKDVRYIRLWFTDVIGTLKSVAIAPAELEEAFDEGIGFDGSSIEGLARVVEADMLAYPDASTFQILPGQSSEGQVARLFCDIATRDGELARSDPRSVLRRALDKASDMGFTFYTHPEIEFYLFHPSSDPYEEFKPIDRAGYFDHSARSAGLDFRREAVAALEAMTIPVEFSHHEAGPGQNEIDLRFTDALTMADSIMAFRTVIQELAISQGAFASFMPKPLIDHPGSGMHTHMSLFEGDRNVFYDPSGEYFLSTTARQFMAGLLEHASSISAITNQHVNSYKRLWGGDEAPSYICWGHNNRSALVRVPALRAGKQRAARIEYRAIDSAANPYLAFAVLLRAGLDGIERDLKLPDEAIDDVLAMTRNERRALGIGSLPGNLEQALAAMQESELVAQTLGEEAFSYFIRNKESEWHGYRNQVTPFERDRFLPVV